MPDRPERGNFKWRIGPDGAIIKCAVILIDVETFRHDHSNQ